MLPRLPYMDVQMPRVQDAQERPVCAPHLRRVGEAQLIANDALRSSAHPMCSLLRDSERPRWCVNSYSPS